jgi:hypothetical protein
MIPAGARRLPLVEAGKLNMLAAGVRSVRALLPAFPRSPRPPACATSIPTSGTGSTRRLECPRDVVEKLNAEVNRLLKDQR